MSEHDIHIGQSEDEPIFRRKIVSLWLPQKGQEKNRTRLRQHQLTISRMMKSISESQG